jgi:Flp pilus assembly protein TadG
MRRPALLRRLGDDRRGVSAVEFALIAPVMIAFYFGLCEFCQAYMAQQRMSHVSATVADLVTQTDTLDTAGMTDIFAVGPMVMEPYASTTLKQRVTHMTMDAGGNLSIDWTSLSGMDPATPRPTLPAGLIDPGESIVMAEATYDYDSPVDYMLPAVTQFSKVYFLRPRRSDKVIWSN